MSHQSKELQSAAAPCSAAAHTPIPRDLFILNIIDIKLKHNMTIKSIKQFNEKKKKHPQISLNIIYGNDFILVGLGYVRV